MRKFLSVVVICLLLTGQTAMAASYQWQTIHFDYPKSWDLLTDKTVDGMRLIHLSLKSHASYPLSIFLSVIPKTPKTAKFLKIRPDQSAQVIATNFAWPIIKRFSKADDKNKLLIGFNDISLAHQLVPGAMIFAPTPQDKIYISAQSFYHNAKDHYIVGLVVSRVDQGTMRQVSSYGSRVRAAYQILDGIQFDKGTS